MKAINGSHSFTTLLQGSCNDITTGHLHYMLKCSDDSDRIMPLNDSQLDSFTNIIWFMTKILLYLSVTVGSFLLGAASKRIEEERHAAVLQAATRRKLSQRSTTLARPAPASPPRTPPATLSLDTNIDSPQKGDRAEGCVEGRPVLSLTPLWHQFQWQGDCQCKMMKMVFSGK